MRVRTARWPSGCEGAIETRASDGEPAGTPRPKAAERNSI